MEMLEFKFDWADTDSMYAVERVENDFPCFVTMHDACGGECGIAHIHCRKEDVSAITARLAHH